MKLVLLGSVSRDTLGTPTVNKLERIQGSTACSQNQGQYTPVFDEPVGADECLLS